MAPWSFREHAITHRGQPSKPAPDLRRGQGIQAWESKRLGLTVDLQSLRTQFFVGATILLLGLCFMVRAEPASQRPVVRILQNSTGLRLDFRFPRLRAERLLTRGGVRVSVTGEWASKVPSSDGKAVASYNAFVALPPEDTPVLRVLRSEWDTLHVRWDELADFPDTVAIQAASRSWAYLPDPQLSEAGVLRGCRLGRITIPLLRRAATGQVLALRSTLIELPMQRPIIPAKPVPAELRRLVLNPDWLVAVPPSLPQPPGQPGVIRIATADSGMIKLTGAELQTCGLNLAEVPVGNLRIRHRGKEIPLLATGLADGRFDPQDTLAFYAEALHGDTCFFYPYSDTNVFWLGWDDRPSSGYYREARASDLAELIPDSIVFHIVHLEEERHYHYGGDDLAIKVTDVVPGEGWVWQLFDPGDALTIPFVVEDPATTDSAIVWIRVRGLSPTGATLDVRVVVNGHDLGVRTFPTRIDTTLVFWVPPGLLREGENEIRVVSPEQPETEIDLWYLDWVEIRYPRRLVWRVGQQLDVWLPGCEGRRRWAVRIPEGTRPTLAYVDRGLVLRDIRLSRAHWDSLQIISAGYDDGDRCQMWIRGRPVVERGGRGHNVVVLHPSTGAILETRTFDTYSDTAEANALADFILSLPDSAVVLVGIRDEGSASMTERAYRALESIGSALCRSVGYRDSWCILGRKGATPGSVPERLVPRGRGSATVVALLPFPDGGPLRVCWTDTIREPHHLVVFEAPQLPNPVRLEVDKPGHLLQGPGAEYVIITHRSFLQQAERLAEYRRAQSGLSVRVVDVQDVYDEFHYGIPSPVAIRQFITYAFWNWPEPRPRYVMLLGDASWDPRRRSEGAAAIDFVPSFGLPVSDARFVCVDGPGDRLPDLPIGRLPVRSAEEAQGAIDKIIEYEALAPGKWTKRFLFVTGGFDDFEQKLFVLQSVSLAHQFLEPPPPAMQWAIVSKQTEGYLEGEGREDILQHVNRGVLWVNFIGHAGSRTWDLMFHNPDIDALRNAPYYPFVTSMTCHTARFANPYQESFGERFVLADGRGAIGFLGTSGWGYVYRDEVLLRALLTRTFMDSLRTLGDIVWLGKLDFWGQRFGDTLDQTIVDQYTLLGDPALRLALPTVPDLAVTPEDVVLQPAVPTVADTCVDVTVRVWNFGLACTESTQVSVQIREPSGAEKGPVTLRLGEVGLIDSVEFAWRPRGAGQYLLHVSVDPGASVPDANRTNNSANKGVRVERGLAEILWPFDGCELPADQSIRAYIRPPSVETRPADGEILVDTTRSFASPLRQVQMPSGSGIPVLTVDLGMLAPGTYFLGLRTRETEPLRDDSIHRFRVSSRPDFGWSQYGRELQDNPFEFVCFGPEGARLGTRELEIEVASAGFDDGNFARILVDGKPAMETFRGHNVCLVDPFGKVRTGSFDTHASTAQAESLATFLESASAGTYFAIAIRDDGSARMTERAYRALEALGSRSCRSVGYRDSWAMTGRVGVPTSVHEVWRPRGQGVAQIVDTCSVYADHGKMTGPWVGPVSSWSQFSIAVSGQEGKLSYELHGRTSVAYPDTTLLAGEIGAAERTWQIDLSALPHRYLSPKAVFSAPDTSVVLRGWRLMFDPPCELIPLRLDVRPPQPRVGSRIEIRLTVLNAGPGDSGPTTVTCYWEDPDGDWHPIGGKPLPRLGPGDSVQVGWAWRSVLPAGKVPIRVAIDPEDSIPELDEANNVLVRPIEFRADSTAPVIRFRIDGRELAHQDYVPSQSVLDVEILETSHYELTDSTLVTVTVDGRNLRELAGASLEFQPLPQGGLVLSAPLQLEPGSHLIEAEARDLAGNRAQAWLSVQVSDRLRIERVLNYPNPFGNGTSFTYFLTLPADRVVIRVFTLAGRKVWETDSAPGDAGFNAFDWDGCDADGDPLANGVYIYTIEAQADTEVARALSKLVIMR